MGLFFELLSAINDPNKQGNVEQLSQTMTKIQELSSQHGIEPSTMQMVMSALGSGLRPMLAQQQLSGTPNQIDNLMGQLTPDNFPLDKLSSFLPSTFQDQIVQQIAQRTNLNATTLQQMLPTLTSTALNLLNMGKSNTGIPGGNPILNTFLDSDKDGDVDLGDVFRFANRFLNPPNAESSLAANN